MTALLSFQGRMGQIRYALWSTAAFASQHLLVLILFKSWGAPLDMKGAFYLVPLRSLVTCAVFDSPICTVRMPVPVLLLGGAYLLLMCWVLAALAFRRAADAGVNEWVAAFAMAPMVQLPIIIGLSLFPSRPTAEGVLTAAPINEDKDSRAAVLGVAAGLGVTLFSVAVGTLLFGTYGYGVFVVSPFLVGATAAYIANRTQDIGARRTANLVLGATFIGGMGLVAAALEGLICIVLASPLGFGVALVGGLLGRAIAQYSRRPARQVLSGFAILPIVFAVEAILPPVTTFDSYQTIEVAAPPEAVWQAVLRMDTMDEPGLLFRLGVAYPIRGSVIGEGVGSVRHGEFSTGTAIEQVIEWVPNSKLAFVVVEDVPAMRELSPYEHVHAPHAVGYFKTSYTSFELVPRADGGTQIVERTSHALKIDPALYWLPMARWIVHENNARVLAHLKRQAELKLR